MTKSFSVALLLLACLTSIQCLAVDSDHPDSPDFDPVARMKRFDPNWEPPEVSAEKIAKHPLGSEDNPVRSHGPTGQRRYLARLECLDGTSPSIKRVGSHGDGVYGFHVDEVEILCGERRSLVFIDLYHPGHVERSPIPGFGLKPEEGSK